MLALRHRTTLPWGTFRLSRSVGQVKADPQQKDCPPQEVGAQRGQRDPQGRRAEPKEPPTATGKMQQMEAPTALMTAPARPQREFPFNLGVSVLSSLFVQQELLVREFFIFTSLLVRRYWCRI